MKLWDIFREERGSAGPRAGLSGVRRLLSIAKVLVKYRVWSGLTPKSMRSCLEELGPAFVKLGQLLASRSEVVPEGHRRELSKLHYRCEPMPFSEVECEMRDAYGDEVFGALFKEVDSIPLGSASIAQVHKAFLSSGKVAAVKVRRRGIKESMASDIGILRALATWAPKSVARQQGMDPVKLVDELWRIFSEEIDLGSEAENLAQFSERARSDGMPGCPRPYRDLCRENVLVMDYVEGKHIGDCPADPGSGLGERLLDSYITQVIEWGFFHTDPHPGNILVKDGDIVYLDLGGMGKLAPDEMRAFERLLMAAAEHDAVSLKDSLISFAEDADEMMDHPRVLADMDDLVERYCVRSSRGIKLSAMMGALIALSRRYRVVLRPSLLDVAKGFITLEGTIGSCIGEVDAVGVVKKWFEKRKPTTEGAKDALDDALHEAKASAVGTLRAMRYSGDVLKMLSRGQLRINMELSNYNEAMRKLSRISNRMAYAFVIAGLLVSASLQQPTADTFLVMGVPVLAFLEYVAAFLMIAGMCIDVFTTRKTP